MRAWLRRTLCACEGEALVTEKKRFHWLAGLLHAKLTCIDDVRITLFAASKSVKKDEYHSNEERLVCVRECLVSARVARHAENQRRPSTAPNSNALRETALRR